MRSYLKLRGDRVEEVTGEIVREQPLTVYVNGERFLTLLCSPMQLEALVIGYLWMEKVIQELDDVTAVAAAAADGRRPRPLPAPGELPPPRALTSGCGGGLPLSGAPRAFPRPHSRPR